MLFSKEKSSFCTDLFPSTLYRRCIEFASKKGDGPTPPPSYAPGDICIYIHIHMKCL